MDALERDYRQVLLAEHEPPYLSLYQPTHRANPDKQQDTIRFGNLVKQLERSLAERFAGRDSARILAPFHELAEDGEFWNRALDGIAVFAAADVFKVYRLQREVKELAIVAESFHTKPLLRILQSMDRYQVLALSRQEAKLFEGNRYALDETSLPAGFPSSSEEVIGADRDDPERRKRAYGPEGPGTTSRHGTDVRQDALNRDTERFFRAVDEAVLEQFSRPSGMPLILAALPEHHSLFRSVSRNPSLITGGIDVNPAALSADELRRRAWDLILPWYLKRLDGLMEQFGASGSEGRSGGDLAEVAKAAVAGRVSTLLIDADRMVPGRLDRATGAIEFLPLEDPQVDDLLDDLGEQTLKTGGEVVIVPRERMPTETGVAAIYRF